MNTDPKHYRYKFLPAKQKNMSPVGKATGRNGRMSKFATCLAVTEVLWVPIQIRIRYQ
jgi:hypothetical protein